MSLAATRDVFWLRARAEDESFEALETRVAAIGRVARDLNTRLADGGAGGLGATSDAYRRLRAVLDAVSTEDLRRMRADVARLHADLTAIERRLAALRTLKAEIDRTETTE